MATLTIRNVPEATKRALEARAAPNDRSMEAEVREILQAATGGTANFVDAWLEAAEDIRALGGIDLELPERVRGRASVTFD